MRKKFFRLSKKINRMSKMKTILFYSSKHRNTIRALSKGRWHKLRSPYRRKTNLNIFKWRIQMSEIKDKPTKKNLEEMYFYFFDGDTALNPKNIIAYYHDTISIDSFNITIEGLSKQALNDLLTDNGYTRLSRHEDLNQKYNKESTKEYLYSDANDYYSTPDFSSIINITNSKKKSFDITCHAISGHEPMLEIKKVVEKHCRKFDKRIQMIIKKAHGYDIEAIDVKKIDIDFKKNYNDDFDYEKLKEAIISDDNGLIILSGVPGSGKSSLIKFIVRHIDKEFCYLPANNIDLFSDPSSLPFLIQELNNKVLVIEDCEKLLKSRKDSGTNDVATILNISDGILADYLNLKIIATLNITENIDDALLRKGRMLYSYDFKKLSIEKSQSLAKELNINEEIDEEMALTDLLNYHKTNGAEALIKTRKIGFGSGPR